MFLSRMPSSALDDLNLCNEMRIIAEGTQYSFRYVFLNIRLYHGNDLE